MNEVQKLQFRADYCLVLNRIKKLKYRKSPFEGGVTLQRDEGDDHPSIELTQKF